MNKIELKKYLEEAEKENKLLHCYMFYGENIENYTNQILLFLTDIAVKKFDKEEQEKKKKQISLGLIEEFNEFDGKDSKVSEVRELFKNILKKPLIISKRIYIIYNFESLSVRSQNTLLKSLEEPPIEDICIILFAKSLNGVLDTIKSRCSKIYLSENDIKKDEGEFLKKYIDLTKILEDANHLQKTIYYMQYSKKITKDNILDVLKLLELLIYDKVKIYSKISKIVIEARKEVLANRNFEMIKDKLLFDIWDEIRKGGESGI